jgi:hypothetical protein
LPGKKKKASNAIYDQKDRRFNGLSFTVLLVVVSDPMLGSRNR